MPGGLRLQTVVATLCLIAIFGCGHTYSITQKGYRDSSSPKGIPFYLKTARCKHETSWLQPVYTLTLKATFTPEPIKQPSPSNAQRQQQQNTTPSGTETPTKVEPFTSTRVVTLTLKEFQGTEVHALVNSLNTGGVLSSGTSSPDEIKDIEDKWLDVVNVAPKAPYALNEEELSSAAGADRERVLRISNVNVPETYVDYSEIYFYNQSRPLAGSAQANIELASDGTMTKASAQAESKTLETFANLLPVKEVVTAAAKGALPTLLLEGQPAKGTTKYELTIDSTIFKHTHCAYLNTVPPCGVPDSELTGKGVPFNLQVEQTSGSTKKATEDDNTISINGSIKMPKATAGNKTEGKQ